MSAGMSAMKGDSGDGSGPILRVENISKHFTGKSDFSVKVARALGAKPKPDTVRAVDDVSFTVERGEVVGLVGESGCGKSTLGRMVAGLIPPSSGSVLYRGEDPFGAGSRADRRNALRIQMIFQDPFASLNPRMRIRDIIGEAPLVHGLVNASELDAHIDEVMRLSGLDPAYKPRFPHQFSGGQRQRIGIARALAVKPEFIVADEAVASLDVSIQAQILNLFMKLRKELSLSYLFVSHSIGVVRHISDRVLVMYLGRLVEEAGTEDLFATPNHPYTRALLREVPRIADRKVDYSPIRGEIPSPLDPPSGCHFHPRCPHATKRCTIEIPELKRIAPGRRSACHLNTQ